MISFMLAVLGSTVFWVIYGAVSLFMTAMILKKRGNKSWAYMILSTGKNPHDTTPNSDGYIWSAEGGDPATSDQYLLAMAPSLFYAIIWPFIAIFWIIKYSMYMIAQLFRFVMQKIFATIPEVKVDFKSESTES